MNQCMRLLKTLYDKACRRYPLMYYYLEQEISRRSVTIIMSDASDNRLVSATIVEIEIESILRQ